jgi:predicted aspartyl protease
LPKIETNTVGKRQVAGVEGRTSAENQDLNSKYACSSVGLSMICKGLINNIAIDMLIYKGSVYTLISYNLFKDIETKNQSKLFVSPCKSTVVSANNEKIDIHGVRDVNIFINGVKYCHSVLIAKDLAHHCLLGTDFLRKHNAKIDFQTVTITVNRSECEINYSSQSTAVCRVSLKQTICIPPGNEMLVEGKVSKKER